jgi:hypothetical protein
VNVGTKTSERTLNIWRIAMTEEIFTQLTLISHQLQTRSYELSQAGRDPDMAMIMSALAVTMDAVGSLREDLSQLAGPKGLGAEGG